MIMVKVLGVLLATFSVSNLPAQIPNKGNYDVKRPKNSKECASVFQLFGTAPKEFRFATYVRQDSVFISSNDFTWFSKIIAAKKDGIAVDLVSQDQFACDQPLPKSSDWSHRGYMLPPVYRDDLMKGYKVYDNGVALFFAGLIPDALKNKTLEANFMVLNNKNRCYYSNVININYHAWGLLKTGFYYDTITREKIKDKYKELSKTLRFTIPFEKDGKEYKPEDIRPLYDSLRITDYAITAINITAYTSVEGSFERNTKLQAERAESVVRALQFYQNEKITSSIATNENWVEFLGDINGSMYDSFFAMSKEEIKEKLKSKDMLSKLEPILRKERKAIIELKLEKRLAYRESDPEQLRKLFRQSIVDRNIDEALHLQNIIFFKIRKEELPEEFMNGLEVPEAIEYGSLLVNNEAFNADLEYHNVFEAIQAFQKLDALLPHNPRIKYNLCILKMRAWLQTSQITDKEMLLKEIIALRNYKIPESLVKRLLINYHIFLSELAKQARDYPGKDRSVQFIYNTYVSLKLNDNDLVNLSKFFCYHSKFDWALQILIPRAKSIDVTEDLLFYYLSLTIYQPRYTANKFYRITMLNAINRNKSKFCDLFASIKNGGITFQLLEDVFLKKTFCENCNN